MQTQDMTSYEPGRTTTQYSPLPQAPVLLLGKTVLLAEDDRELRYVMECILKSMGYLVLPCADAEEASSAFQSHASIDALLTDLQMPGRSGVELARELTGLRPTLPVMIITGSILSGETLQEIEDRSWIYVSKPCKLPQLEATLKQITTADDAAGSGSSTLAA